MCFIGAIRGVKLENNLAQSVVKRRSEKKGCTLRKDTQK